MDAAWAAHLVGSPERDERSKASPPGARQIINLFLICYCTPWPSYAAKLSVGATHLYVTRLMDVLRVRVFL